MKKKKILILANNDAGLYKFRKELIDELKDGYNLSISFPFGDYYKLFESENIRVIDTKIDRRGTNIVSDLKLFFKYFKIIKNLSPDLVLTYTIKPNIYGNLVTRILRIPTITTITGLGSGFSNTNILGKLVKFLLRIALKKTHFIVFQNSSNYEAYKKYRIISEKSKYRIVSGSGVNIKKFPIIPYPSNNKIKLLYIGRIMKEKGITELLQVSKLLHDNIEFNLIGDLEENYSELIKEYESKRYLIYHGVKKDIRPYIAESDALILPSYHEGMSNVLLEGGSSGRPLLASKIPGCSEIIDDRITGFLFEVKNFDDLKRKIIEFASLSNHDRMSMGIKARQKIEKEFNRQDVIMSYLEMIKEIV